MELPKERISGPSFFPCGSGVANRKYNGSKGNAAEVEILHQIKGSEYNKLYDIIG